MATGTGQLAPVEVWGKPDELLGADVEPLEDDEPCEDEWVDWRADEPVDASEVLDADE